jgi:hypothetical protein
VALKVIEGVVEAPGLATVLVSEAGPTGMAWTFPSISQRQQKPATLEKVVADLAFGAHLALGQAGRFAVFPHDGQFVLCGFARAGGLEIATAASDPDTKPGSETPGRWQPDTRIERPVLLAVLAQL